MTRNRNLVWKLKDRRHRVTVKDVTEQVLAEIREEEKMMDKSDTPRTDNFVATLPALVLDDEDFTDREACVRTMVRLREHMIGWAAFARTLERELMQSTPKEWKE